MYYRDQAFRRWMDRSGCNRILETVGRPFRWLFWPVVLTVSASPLIGGMLGIMFLRQHDMVPGIAELLLGLLALALLLVRFSLARESVKQTGFVEI